MSTLNVTKRGDKWQYRFEAASVDGKRKRVSFYRSPEHRYREHRRPD